MIKKLGFRGVLATDERRLVLLIGLSVMIGLIACVTSSPEAIEESIIPNAVQPSVKQTDNIKPTRQDQPGGEETKTNSDKTGKIKLSLEQCLQVALDNNRQLLISKEERLKAKGKMQEADALRYPNLSANLSYNRVDKVTTFSPGAGVPSIEIGSLNNYNAEVVLKQTLYQGGRIDAMIESAKLGKQLAEMQFLDTKEFIVFHVTKSYYDVLLSQETLGINQKSLANAIANLDNVKLLNQQGVASNYKVLRAEVQVSNIRTLVLQSESNLRLTKLDLLRAMGIPTDDDSSDIELSDQLNYKDQSADFRQSLDTAFQMRADLSRAKLMIEMQRKNITVAKSNLRPDLSLFANGGKEKPSRFEFGENQWGDYWVAGAMVSFPLFEGDRTMGKVIQERAILNQYQITLKDTEEKIRYEVKQAFLSLNDAEELINSQKENVKQAEEGLRLADIGFKNGVNTQLEVLDTQLALDVARKNYLSAIYSYNLAQLMMQKAMGVLRNK